MKRIILKLRIAFANSTKRPGIYRKYLSVNIGNNCRFTGDINFGSEPFLISIGNHVTLAHNVTFHTHDGGVWVFRDKYPNINIYGKISVGNNVFIGSDVIILPNVTIGDNVVVGTGSVVTKSVESNTVVVGNPAKMIRKIDDYEEKVLKNAIFLDSKDMMKESNNIIEHLNNKDFEQNNNNKKGI